MHVAVEGLEAIFHGPFLLGEICIRAEVYLSLAKKSPFIPLFQRGNSLGD
jgi:hypothetical protein